MHVTLQVRIAVLNARGAMRVSQVSMAAITPYAVCLYRQTEVLLAWACISSQWFEMFVTSCNSHFSRLKFSRRSSYNAIGRYNLV